MSLSLCKPDADTEHRLPSMKLVIFIFGYLLVIIGVFFGSAGRWDLPLAWAFIGVYVAFILAMPFLMEPELRRERINPGPGGIDRNIRWMMLPFMLGFWILAGLEIRWHGPSRVPLALQLAGLIGFAGALTLALWAVSQNRFFSPVVRIQKERGHQLVTTGPYRWIRHPGYLGGALGALCSALALGSWWALLPAAGTVALLIRRTILEDRFLHAELTGYADYARTVRCRLLPGIW